MIAECRAGMRRYAGTDRGEEYSVILGRLGEGDTSPPGVAGRTLGDYLHPHRAASPTTIVNTVSQAIGGDAAPWRFERSIRFVAGLEGRE